MTDTTQTPEGDAAIEDLLKQDPEAKTEATAKATRQTRAEKLAELFGPPHDFEVVGEVHLEPGETFQTALGHKGRHGFHIRDKNTGEEQIVGATLIQKIADDFGTIVVPPKPEKVKPEPAPEPLADVLADEPAPEQPAEEVAAEPVPEVPEAPVEQPAEQVEVPSIPAEPTPVPEDVPAPDPVDDIEALLS